MPIIRYLFVALLISGCLGPVKKLYPEEEQQRRIPVYLISHGWHVALAFEAEHLQDKLPDHNQLPSGNFLMIGWGDNKYYPSERGGVDLLLRAAFLPTGSVIHVVGLNKDVSSYFSNSDIILVQITDEGMKEMSNYLADQFAYDSEGNLQFAAEGLYSNSTFFEARGLYFFPRTSNKWTARVLRKSGFPITPFYAITSGNVIQQVRKSGDVIQRR